MNTAAKCNMIATIRSDLMPHPIPSPKQLEFLDWEFGVFFHFGIRTYFKGHTDWDNRPMPAEAR